MVSLEYFAHACFLIHFDRVKVLIDPYDPAIGYKMPERNADFVLVSHDHFDHNYVAGVSGRTTVVRGCAARRLDSVQVHGVLADHDEEGGLEKGHVTLFCLKSPQGMSLCHLSDLNHPLSPEQVDEIGPCDVIMLPVGGGGNCLDARNSVEVARQLKARLIIPMHYRTPFLSRELFPSAQGLEPFLKEASRYFPIVQSKESPVKLEALPQRPTVLNIPHLY